MGQVVRVSETSNAFFETGFDRSLTWMSNEMNFDGIEIRGVVIMHLQEMQVHV
jgi:hypothetical protein